ncbi:MAG: zinc ribbon domain-containing protein [Chloroflexi bacterium]|nr:MAG: zinc ribbon domain-containing protein [Chloroflexota bacterium]
MTLSRKRERGTLPSVDSNFVEQVQVACDNCGAQLVTGAAYCERCGARTRKARRLVRLAIRVELLFFALVVILVIAFTWIYAVQK